MHVEIVLSNFLSRSGFTRDMGVRQGVTMTPGVLFLFFSLMIQGVTSERIIDDTDFKIALGAGCAGAVIAVILIVAALIYFSKRHMVRSRVRRRRLLDYVELDVQAAGRSSGLPVLPTDISESTKEFRIPRASLHFREERNRTSAVSGSSVGSLAFGITKDKDLRIPRASLKSSSSSTSASARQISQKETKQNKQFSRSVSLNTSTHSKAHLAIHHSFHGYSPKPDSTGAQALPRLMPDKRNRSVTSTSNL